MENFFSMLTEVVEKVDASEVKRAVIGVIKSSLAVETSSETMCIKDVSAFLGVNEQTIYRLIRQGKIPVSPEGGKKKIPKVELLELLDSGELVIRGSKYDKWHHLNSVKNGKN